MIRLFYTSTLGTGVDRTEIEQILRVARRNNERDEITGMLILHEQKILQFLEGPEDKVTTCFDRIQQDTRHASVFCMHRLDAAKRAFSNWSMGLAKVDDMPVILADNVRSLTEITTRIDAVKDMKLDFELDGVARRIRRFMAQFGEFQPKLLG